MGRGCQVSGLGRTGVGLRGEAAGLGVRAGQSGVQGEAGPVPGLRGVSSESGRDVDQQGSQDHPGRPVI